MQRPWKRQRSELAQIRREFEEWRRGETPKIGRAERVMVIVAALALLWALAQVTYL
jgi:hypothetical protein